MSRWAASASSAADSVRRATGYSTFFETMRLATPETIITPMPSQMWSISGPSMIFITPSKMITAAAAMMSSASMTPLRFSTFSWP